MTCLSEAHTDKPYKVRLQNVPGRMYLPIGPQDAHDSGTSFAAKDRHQQLLGVLVSSANGGSYRAGAVLFRHSALIRVRVQLRLAFV